MNNRLESWLHAARWTALLEFALLALLAAALAHWTWIAVTPRALAGSALSGTSELEHAGAPVKRNLFGAGAPGSPLQPETAASSLKLLGVISPGIAGKGRAVFAAEKGNRRVVSAGESLSAGVILREVNADHVVVARDGAIERIALDRRAAAAVSPNAKRDAAR